MGAKKNTQIHLTPVIDLTAMDRSIEEGIRHPHHFIYYSESLTPIPGLTRNVALLGNVHSITFNSRVLMLHNSMKSGLIG